MMVSLRMALVGTLLLVGGVLGAQQEKVEVTVGMGGPGRQSAPSFSYPVLVLRSGVEIPYARYTIE